VLQKFLSTGRKKPDLAVTTKTTSEDAGFQHTSNIACVNAHRVGQKSYSTIHHSYAIMVSHHLRLTICRATGPAAGKFILSKSVSAPSGTLQGVTSN